MRVNTTQIHLQTCLQAHSSLNKCLNNCDLIESQLCFLNEENDAKNCKQERRNSPKTFSVFRVNASVI